MSVIRFLAIALIVVGVLGLVYGGFSYTSETHQVDLGTIELSVKDKEMVNVPLWAGVGAVALGTLLLLGFKRS